MTHRERHSSRKDSLGFVWVALLCAGLAIGATKSAGPAALADLPNVILVGLDTVRADHLGCYGNRQIATPALDSLAAESVLFENCYSAATWTLPAFASVFTGRLPYEHGLVRVMGHKLSPDIITMAEVLQAFGYFTKAHVAVDFLTSGYNMDAGFDSLQYHLGGATTGRLTRYEPQVLDFLRSEPKSPYFLFVHFFDAHAPYKPPPPYDSKYYDGDPSDPADSTLSVIYSDRNRILRDPHELYAWLNGITDIRFPVAQYAGAISYLDHHLGRLFDTLRATGELDRSIVIVLADHGEHLTEHDLYFTHFLPYQECLHVPLIIRLPHAKWAGRRVRADVSLVDVLPTLVELLNLPVSMPTDGRSLLPLMRGKRMASKRLFYAEFGSQPDEYVKAVWDSRYRLLSFHLFDRSWVELYDRKRDPQELKNVASNHEREVRRLTDALRKRFRGPSPITRQGIGDEESPMPAAMEERLRSLGYIH